VHPSHSHNRLLGEMCVFNRTSYEIRIVLFIKLILLNGRSYYGSYNYHVYRSTLNYVIKCKINIALLGLKVKTNYILATLIKP
jgi:hypothetical protein